MLSNQELTKELREISKDLAPALGKEVKVPDLSRLKKGMPKTARKGNPKISKETKKLLEEYRNEEGLIYSGFKKERKEFQKNLKADIKEIKDWAKEEIKRGGTKKEITWRGKKKISSLKMEKKKKLSSLKKEYLDKLKTLKQKYKKKDSDFLRALTSQEVKKFKAEAAIVISITFLTYLLTSIISLPALVLVLFLDKNVNLNTLKLKKRSKI